VTERKRWKLWRKIVTATKKMIIGTELNESRRPVHNNTFQNDVVAASVPMTEQLTCVPFVYGGLNFKSQEGQILHSVANGSLPLQHLWKQLCCLVRYLAEIDSANSLHASA